MVYEILTWKNELRVKINRFKFAVEIFGYLYFFFLCAFISYTSPNRLAYVEGGR